MGAEGFYMRVVYKELREYLLLYIPIASLKCEENYHIPVFIDLRNRLYLIIHGLRIRYY